MHAGRCIYHVMCVPMPKTALPSESIKRAKDVSATAMRARKTGKQPHLEALDSFSPISWAGKSDLAAGSPSCVKTKATWRTTCKLKAVFQESLSNSRERLIRPNRRRANGKSFSLLRLSAAPPTPYHLLRYKLRLLIRLVTGICWQLVRTSPKRRSIDYPIASTKASHNIVSSTLVSHSLGLSVLQDQ